MAVELRDETLHFTFDGAAEKPNTKPPHICTAAV